MIKQFLRKYPAEITGLLAGTLGGFLYWKYVGCLTGSCAIQSNWYLMVPWGAVMGWLVGSVTGEFLRKRKRGEREEES